MKLETKYEIGDFIWFIGQRKIARGKINDIQTNTTVLPSGELHQKVQYGATNSDGWQSVEEQDCYPTKQALIQAFNDDTKE